VFHDLKCRMERAAQRMRENAQSGVTALEFAIIAPIFFMFLFGIIETGAIFWGESTLFYATADTARMVRTGQLTGAITASQLKTQICSRVTGILTTANCTANLQVDMRSYGSFGASGTPSVTNADGTLNSGGMAVQSTSACQTVLLRAFYPWTIMAPIMRPMLQTMPGGIHLMYSAAAFRTEPYNNTPCT